MRYGRMLLDAHMHYAYPISESSLIDILRETGVDLAVLAALPGGQRLDPTPDILALKARYPERIFAFGCLDCTDYLKPRAGFSRRAIHRVRRLTAAGCDGLKLLEGKPTLRREYPIPDFDAAAWAGFWEFAEETRLPILFHVNDPIGFWDESKASARAKEQGWLYGADCIGSSEQYRQIRAVMERHPHLNICFAHCFFLSAQLPRLSEWMEAFPNMRVDLTPAIEVYAELSETPEDTLAFLTRFSARILYGTDTGGRAVLAGATQINRAEALRRADIAQSFLSDKGAKGIRDDGDYLVGVEPFVLRGMGLSDEMLARICYENFLDFISRRTPVSVDNRKAERLCRETMRALERDARRRHTRPDLSAPQAALNSLLAMHEEEE